MSINQAESLFIGKKIRKSRWFHQNTWYRWIWVTLYPSFLIRQYCQFFSPSLQIEIIEDTTFLPSKDDERTHQLNRNFIFFIDFISFRRTFINASSYKTNLIACYKCDVINKEKNYLSVNFTEILFEKIFSVFTKLESLNYSFLFNDYRPLPLSISFPTYSMNVHLNMNFVFEFLYHFQWWKNFE